MDKILKLTSSAAAPTPTAPLPNSSFHSLLFSPDDIMPLPSLPSSSLPLPSSSLPLPSLPLPQSLSSPIHQLQNTPSSSTSSQSPFPSSQPFSTLPGNSICDIPSMVDLAFRLCLQIFLPEVLKTHTLTGKRGHGKLDAVKMGYIKQQVLTTFKANERNWEDVVDRLQLKLKNYRKKIFKK